MRSTRDHRGVSAETSTLPRTSDGQNGAVAVVGSLNKGNRGVAFGNPAILAGERCGLTCPVSESRRLHAQLAAGDEFLLEIGRCVRSALGFAGLLFREGVNRLGH